MSTFEFRNKAYEVDDKNFLIDFTKWDENFAIGMAPHLNIHNGLTEKHWCIINCIRDTFHETGVCPVVYKPCRACNLRFNELKNLFPTGYQRGACLLSGISYKDLVISHYSEKYIVSRGIRAIEKELPKQKEKVYQINAFGFLIDPSEWDIEYAANRAYEMGISGGLTDKHWKIIHFLRDSYEKNKTVPSVYECCESNHIDIDELEILFPTGYHRGAVKIAGLRLR